MRDDDGLGDVVIGHVDSADHKHEGADDGADMMTVVVQHAGRKLSVSAHASTLMPDFALGLAADLTVVYEKMTFIDQRRRRPGDGSGPVSFKYPFEDVRLDEAFGTSPKVRLIAPLVETVDRIGAEIKEVERVKAIMAARAAARREGSGRKLPQSKKQPTTISGTSVGVGVRKLDMDDGRPAVSAEPYFRLITPLTGFRDAQQALDLLSRLATDRGIQTVMSRHNLVVGTLSELDPTSATTHSGTETCRTLGLNQGGGHTIWLRLRTDLYDGWCTYKDIRRTLCHELAHNRHQNHEKEFWAFCRQLVREVEAGDYWGGSGRVIGGGDGLAGRVVGDDDDDDFEAADGDDSGGGLYQGSARVGGDDGGEADQAEVRRKRAAAAEERLARLRRK